MRIVVACVIYTLVKLVPTEDGELCKLVDDYSIDAGHIQHERVVGCMACVAQAGVQRKQLSANSRFYRGHTYRRKY